MTVETEKAITLEDMVTNVAESAGTTKVQARRVIKAFVNELADQIASENTVAIYGLGSFHRRSIRSHYKYLNGRRVLQKRYSQIYFSGSDKIYSRINSHLRQKTKGKANGKHGDNAS